MWNSIFQHAGYITSFIKRSPIRKQGRSVDPLMGGRKGEDKTSDHREESPFRSPLFSDVTFRFPFLYFPSNYNQKNGYDMYYDFRSNTINYNHSKL